MDLPSVYSIAEQCHKMTVKKISGCDLTGVKKELLRIGWKSRGVGSKR
jgi:hypothetical protein